MLSPKQFMHKIPLAQHWLATLLTCVMAFTLVAATPSLAAAQDNDEDGVLIVRVMPGSPAADAGLRRGDIILSVDGAPVNSAAELMKTIATHVAGDEIELAYRHGSEERVTTAVLAAVDGRTLLGVQPYQDAPTPMRREAQPPQAQEQPEEMPQFRLQVLEPGAQIVEVMDDSPASAAGLEVGDVITAVDGEAVSSPEALVETIGGYAPGETVTLAVTRGDEELSIDVTLAAREDDTARGFMGVQIGPVLTGDMPWEEGVPFNMPFGSERALPMLSGVLVRDVAADSPAAEAGLQPGDWITEVNGESVEDFEDLRSLIEAAQPGDEMTLTLQSGMLHFGRGAEATEPESRTVTVTLGENETGGAFLGISVMPARFHMHEDMPKKPGSPDTENSPGEDQGNVAPYFFFRDLTERPNLPFFFFNPGLPNEEGVDLFFHGLPDGGSKPIEVTPLPSQEL